MTSAEHDPFLIPGPGQGNPPGPAPMPPAAPPQPWTAPGPWTDPGAAASYPTPVPVGSAPPRRRRGVPEYDEPVPYHRILRTRSYRWWRPLVGLVVTAVTFVVISLVVTTAALLPAIVTGSIDLDEAQADPAGALVSDPLGLLGVNLSLAAFIPAVVLGLLAGHQIRPGYLNSVIGRMRWKFLFLCLLIELGVTLVILPLSGLAGGPAPAPDEVTTVSFAEWLPFAVVILLTTPLQAAGEEYGFRGYGLQVLGAWVRSPWFGIIVTSLLFAAAHGTQSPALFLNRFAFGIVAGVLTVRTGGLEAAIGIHVVNNLVVLLLASATGQLAPSLTPSEAPWGVALLDVAGMVAYAFLALWLARRMGLEQQTHASPPRPVSSGPPYPPPYPPPPVPAPARGW